MDCFESLMSPLYCGYCNIEGSFNFLDFYNVPKITHEYFIYKESNR